MGDRSIAGHDKIEMSHRRRRIDEGVRAGVEILAQRLDDHAFRQRGELLRSRPFLQRDQAHVGQSRQRSECGEWD